jgi:hypothetical protein
MSAIKIAPAAALKERLRQLDTERRRIRTLLKLAEIEEREFKSQQSQRSESQKPEEGHRA